MVPVSGPTIDAINSEIVLKMADKDAVTPVEEQRPDHLLTRLIASKEWHGDIQRTRTKRFTHLYKLLIENLHDRTFFDWGG